MQKRLSKLSSSFMPVLIQTRRALAPLIRLARDQAHSFHRMEHPTNYPKELYSVALYWDQSYSRHYPVFALLRALINIDTW